MSEQTTHLNASLGRYQDPVDRAIAQMAQQRVVERIWAHDHTVWKPQPAEITNRLGWLYIAGEMLPETPRLVAFARSLAEEGCSDVLLLGMGGSSLAPEVFGKVFSAHHGLPGLAVLDTTDPGAVRAYAQRLDPARTLFIVSTKSGGTVETLSGFKFFYNHAADALGMDRAGSRFVAITDPGSSLAGLAERYGFRTVFYGDPNIGGRYSALSYFGLVPAAIVGVEVETLLGRALAMAAQCRADDGPGARLGAILGELAMAGRDKVTFVVSPAIASFGDWVEQLVAESTGKEGKGILPVVGEPLGPPGVYGADRLFVHLRLAGDSADDAAVQALEDAGQPVVRLMLDDAYDLGAQFFLWEMATSIACHRLGINPFDQPNVEAAKSLARKVVAAYSAAGRLPADEAAPLTGKSVRGFLELTRPGDYLAIQAYLRPGDATDAAFRTLRARLRDQLGVATTVGYGPRFLHSTGQLHKGDAGNGLFVQLTADDPHDLPIPDEAGLPQASMTFGVLKMAQALGDKQALLDAGRRVIRFHLGQDLAAGLGRLAVALL